MTQPILLPDVTVQGDLRVTGTVPEVPRSRIQQTVLASYAVPLTSLRVWDAMHTLLPGTSANDDLAIVGGTFGTDGASIETYDVKAAGSVALYGRMLIQLPPEYEAGETVELRVRAGMVTNAADNSATVDFEAYKLDKEGGIGSDLVDTAAQSINSLTFANKDFTITPTGLSAGDILDVRVAVAVNDAATGTEVKARLGTIELLCDIRG